MKTDEILADLFDGRPHVLAGPFSDWLAGSRRFTAFAAGNHTKIRKKIRSTTDPESLRDLQLELETAYLLLREQALGLVYEPIPPGRGRSPDFSVAYTTSLAFMVEVTRLRPAELPNAPGRLDPEEDGPHLENRFTDMLCGKLGQLLPSRINLLVVGVEPAAAARLDLPPIMIGIQQGAEAGDPNVIQKHGFRDRADFFNGFRKLSAVLMRGIPLAPGAPAVLWENPQAKFPLPAKVRTALIRSHQDPPR